MSLLRRLKTVLGAKANELLDRVDDRGEALDYAHQSLRDELERARQAIAHLTTARQLLVLQSLQLEEWAARLESQAREALESGRDDLAREALARRSVLKSGIASLGSEAEQLSDEEERFMQATGLLEREIEILGARKEAVKASYAGAGANAEIEEAISKTRDDIANVSMTVRRAEERSGQLRAQSRRIDALLASGALRDLSSSPQAIASELVEARRSDDVASELATLKRASRDS